MGKGLRQDKIPYNLVSDKINIPSLSPLDIKKKINHASHVVLLDAGTSLGAFSGGDIMGRTLTLMRNLV